MTHSEIVSELLHKLSKNELLLQDGGKSQYYRSQLNSMMGRGEEEDKMTDGIIADINQLIPVSLLDRFVEEAKKTVDSLRESETSLQVEVSKLRAALGENMTNKDALKLLQSELVQKENELDEIRKKSVALEASLSAKENELSNAAKEVDKLKQNIRNIGIGVTSVKSKTSDNIILKAYLDKIVSATPSPS
jgi:DNA repair exonuclease SbcCD ATPase subunit